MIRIAGPFQEHQETRIWRSITPHRKARSTDPHVFVDSSSHCLPQRLIVLFQIFFKLYECLNLKKKVWPHVTIWERFNLAQCLNFYAHKQFFKKANKAKGTINEIKGQPTVKTTGPNGITCVKVHDSKPRLNTRTNCSFGLSQKHHF